MAGTKFSELFDRYYDGLATEAETRELKELINSGDHQKELEESLREKWTSISKSNQFFAEEVRERMLENILRPATAKVRKMYWLRRAVAVAAILILVAGGYYYFDKSRSITDQNITAQKQDIAPGHAGAVVRLSDGREIALDTAKDGLIAMDGDVRIIKANGQIRYEGNTKQVVYNETSTDRGRSWPVQLPDGSIAWLNSSSSIRYPIGFSGKERRVQMKGECFFEVVHNDQIPFRVELPNGEVVEDVGTAFNIRAYGDEAITRTTVTEGVANISSGNMKYTIPAGQQAESQQGKVARVAAASQMDEIIAWKDNRFRFRNARVQEILKEAARWYDMDVQYEGEIKETYTISMSRSVPLSKLLNDLEQSGGVHFIIEGNRVTVKR